MRRKEAEEISVFVISDPHLSMTADKPMDVFGMKWENHTERFADLWQSTVSESDTVVIPGDISWGMGFGDSADDLRFIDRLNGRKLIGKGNHDYWWSTAAKLEKFRSAYGLKTLSFLYNNAFLAENIIVCGTRFWALSRSPSPDDIKILAREAGRFRLSLTAAEKISASCPEAEKVAFLHYPPVFGDIVSNEMLTLMNTHGVKRCFYGHIHGVSPRSLPTSRENIALKCVSADLLDFKPIKIN